MEIRQPQSAQIACFTSLWATILFVPVFLKGETRFLRIRNKEEKGVIRGDEVYRKTKTAIC